MIVVNKALYRLFEDFNSIAFYLFTLLCV